MHNLNIITHFYANTSRELWETVTNLLCLRSFMANTSRELWETVTNLLCLRSFINLLSYIEWLWAELVCWFYSVSLFCMLFLGNNLNHSTLYSHCTVFVFFWCCNIFSDLETVTKALMHNLNLCTNIRISLKLKPSLAIQTWTIQYFGPIILNTETRFVTYMISYLRVIEIQNNCVKLCFKIGSSSFLLESWIFIWKQVLISHKHIESVVKLVNNIWIKPIGLKLKTSAATVIQCILGVLMPKYKMVLGAIE